MDGSRATVWHCNQAGPCFLQFDLKTARPEQTL